MAINIIINHHSLFIIIIYIIIIYIIIYIIHYSLYNLFLDLTFLMEIMSPMALV